MVDDPNFCEIPTLPKRSESRLSRLLDAYAQNKAVRFEHAGISSVTMRNRLSGSLSTVLGLRGYRLHLHAETGAIIAWIEPLPQSDRAS